MLLATDLSTARWRTSSHSGQNECVQVAGLPGVVAVRDSKNPKGPALTFPLEAWRAFAGRVKTDLV